MKIKLTETEPLDLSLSLSLFLSLSLSLSLSQDMRILSYLEEHQPLVLFRPSTDWMQSTHISGEGNGTPLQYSCLENPMDGGAWLQSMGSLRVGHN